MQEKVCESHLLASRGLMRGDPRQMTLPYRTGLAGNHSCTTALNTELLFRVAMMEWLAGLSAHGPQLLCHCNFDTTHPSI